MSEEEGYIKLSRRFFSHVLWPKGGVFSPSEAWLDCIQMAAFRDHRRLVGKTVIEIPRGAIAASERFLAERWSWSRTKIRRFLTLLQDERMVVLKKDQEVTLITLCNFERYNAPLSTEKPEKDQEKTTKEPREDQIEEGKEGEEGKRTPAGNPTTGFDEFWNAYPKKHGKHDAQMAWTDQSCHERTTEILTAVEAAKRSANWTKEHGRFIPKAGVWLRDRRWEEQKFGSMSKPVIDLSQDPEVKARMEALAKEDVELERYQSLKRSLPPDDADVFQRLARETTWQNALKIHDEGNLDQYA